MKYQIFWEIKYPQSMFLSSNTNKSTACGCKRSAANSKSKMGHNCAKNILRVTSPIGTPFHNEQLVRVSSKYLQ